MHQLDASFREQKAKLQQTKRRRYRRRILFGLPALAFAVMGVALYAWWDSVYYPLDEDLVASEELDLGEEGLAPEAVYVPAIVYLAGDPLLINLETGSSRQSAVRIVEAPAGLADAGVTEPVGILSEVMLNSSERFMAALPSSPEDFAFFQSQRDPVPVQEVSFTPETVLSGAEDIASAAPVDPSVAPEDGGAGWGETIENGQVELPDFTRTRVEDTTSVAGVVPEGERFRQTEDLFIRVLDSKTVDSVLIDNGFGTAQAAGAAEALKSAFELGALESGTIVAMRGLKADAKTATMQLVQLSIYTAERYRGTLALSDTGSFVKAVDPWVGEDLSVHFPDSAEAPTVQRYRLIDAIYSTAARNSVPTSIIGEVIMHLSRSHDLNEFAEFSQKLVLVYSEKPRDPADQGGRVLYVAIQGGPKDIECFVFKAKPEAEFGCLSELNEVEQMTVQNGMVVPVSGVMTSTFGPRKHPILKTVRVHKGVDWAAPVGTPVRAAFAGTIEFAGDGNGYGNLVKIDHGDGRATRYAHLSRFAEGLAAGRPVAAGDTIGFIGTTGLSTGPHLHFELYVGGTAIDPLGGGTPAAAAADITVDDGGAVDQLVNKIIRVESGGRANAKNPLSSATGLGQFISSTWLRMMTTYRPDLVRSLSREELLLLRNDPTLSREMIQNLARENEASLRAGGHSITAGRLYLAHFLGPGGANIVLSASPEADLAELLGQSVINANPFLTGKNASYVVSWAERKMSGKAPRSTPAAAPVVEKKEVARASPAFEKYKNALTELMATPSASL